jgi:hypothetical protein
MDNDKNMGTKEKEEKVSRLKNSREVEEKKLK